MRKLLEHKHVKTTINTRVHNITGYTRSKKFAFVFACFLVSENAPSK